MAMIKVWGYKSNGEVLCRRATRAALDKYGLVPAENSEIEVDELFINAEGFTRPEYMTFHIAVRHSEAFAGYALDGARLCLMAGEYDARLILREFSALVGAELCLQVVNADQRQQGSDLWIKMSEYGDLDQFPDEIPPQRLTVQSWRLTTAHDMSIP